MAGRLRVDWPTFWGAVAFLVVGGGFALFGGYHLVTTRAFMAGATERPALVLHNPASCDDEGCTWWPTLRVTGPDGAERDLRTRVGASNYGFGEGTELTVFSNPEYDYVRIPGAGNLYLMGGAFFALGMLPVLIAIWLLSRLVFTRDPAA